jgi:hypothetical protein
VVADADDVVPVADGAAIPLPRPSPVAKAKRQLALAMPPRDSLVERDAGKPVLQAHNKAAPPPDPDNRTAVYDIAAHTVFLPGGERLEAHSGLGDKMDDPRYVKVKNRGPTPPNVYDLTLRESLFHGVQAIRLNPLDERRMFGRDGMLAHTYMLGPNGQSNGCVSFRNYPKFLRAFLRGDVDRLVVVADLGDTPWHVVAARNARSRQYADSRP